MPLSCWSEERYASALDSCSIGERPCLDPGVTLVEKPFSEAALLNRIRTLLDTP